MAEYPILAPRARFENESNLSLLILKELDGWVGSLSLLILKELDGWGKEQTTWVLVR